MNLIKKIIQRYGCSLLCVSFLLSLFFAVPATVSATKTDTEIAATNEAKVQTVRVGWYEDSYHITGENGERSGYGYEYEQAVAAYTGWNYDYVKDDWETLLKKLQNGEIDLMGALSYTEERAKTMLFSDLPMGEEKYYLYADLVHTDISASDLSTLNGKKIVMMESSVQTTQFCEWEKNHNIHTQHIFVDSFERAKEMAENQEIDGVISTETPAWVEAGMSAIATTGQSNIYYAINKKRPDLKEALDSAMRSMEYDKPFYSDELYLRYLASQSVAVLSSEEQEWLNQHGAIRVGYLTNDSGVSVVTSGGEIIGVINDYISYASNCLNKKLAFKLIGFETQEEQMEALANDEIDMIFHVNQNPYYAEKNNLALSNTVLTIPLAAVTTQDFFDEDAENSVAVEKENNRYKWYISYNYPKWKIVECDSTKEVEKAVLSGQADCFIAKSGQLINYESDKKLHSVFLTESGNTSFAVRKGNRLLMSILNKTLKTMQTSKLSGRYIDV